MATNHARGVVVGNPGSIPELSHMASGLAAAGMLKTYVTPVAVPPERRGPIARALRRRPRPAHLTDGQVRLEGTASEFAVVAAQRLRTPASVTSSMIRRRNRWFDARLQNHVERGDRAVIAAHGAALATLRHASEIGVPSFLEYPIAHHRYAAALLAEEARLRPEFAGTLQFHQLPAAEQRRREEEIEAADHVFVLSTFQRRTFIESGVAPEKLLLTPLGVDLDLFRPRPRPDDGVFRVIFVGQITQRKGISYLLDAFRMAAIPRSELVFVGNPVGDTAPWRAQPGVRHVTHVPRWQLPEYYATADVYVLPSLIEGFGLTALEAMACGKPVIVSEHTFGDDVITDGEDGFVVRIRDSGSIAERLRQLHSDPELLTRISCAARGRSEEFSWGRYGIRVTGAVRHSSTSATEATHA